MTMNDYVFRSNLTIIASTTAKTMHVVTRKISPLTPHPLIDQYLDWNS